MRKPLRSTTLPVALLIMACVLCLSPAMAEKPDMTWKEGQILVKPNPGLSDIELDKILHKNNGRAIGKVKNIGVHIVKVPAQAEEAVAKALSKNKNIQFAEPDVLVKTGMVANDPYFGQAWHLPKIKATDAWNISLADGVTVAILDGGVDGTHPELQQHMVQGWNAVSGDSNTTDVNGHGTNVAGTVAAQSNNGVGVTSIAWNAKIMPIRVTNQSSGDAYWSDVANGLVWAADHGADVANISYQGVSGSSTITSAAQYMRNKGGVVVVSAGNTGTSYGFAPNPYLITVSATDTNDTLTSWSSYGNEIDISAPGVNILTTGAGGGYMSCYGTSFSSPVVAAVVALMKAANPDLSPGELEAVLANTAVDAGATGWDAYYGYGRVDAGAAVQMAANAQPSDTTAPTAVISSPTGGTTVADIVNVTVNATDDFGVAKVELYAASTLVGTATTAPYTFSWDTTTVADGSVTLTAKAYDLAGNQNSASVSVKVQNGTADSGAPIVTITSPADGSTVSGNVQLAAYATDDIKVSSVNVYVDGKLKCSGAPSVSCNWNTRKEASGTYTVSAMATDSSGNTANTSVSVSIGGSSDSGTSTKGGGRGKK